MSTEEILQSRMALSKYLVESIVNYLPNNRFSIMDDNNIENKMKNIKITDKTVFSI